MTKAFKIKRLGFDKFRSDSKDEINTLERENEKIRKEAREVSEKQAGEVDHLHQKLADLKARTEEVGHP